MAPMTLAAHDGDPALLALFATEARAHLGQIDAGLAWLRQGGDGAALDAILESLHTLGGAARAVDLFDLELLCRALERLCAAARGAGAAPAPVDAIAGALALAPQLIGEPAGRLRNQALAACRRLDALAAQLVQPSHKP